MSELNRLFLLSVGVELPPESSELIEVRAAFTGRETIGILRACKVDLLLAGRAISDMSLWKLIERIRAARPQQKWALADSQITAEEEIRARSLGAMFVCNVIPDCARLHELARELLEKPTAKQFQLVSAVLGTN
jgi:DNA-binding NtrC family response regulator